MNQEPPHLLEAGRVRFDQYEEFRGTMAKEMDEGNRRFTHDAFALMNNALAERVLTLRA